MGRSRAVLPIAERPDLELTPEEYVRGVIDVLERLPVSAIDDVVDRLFQAYEQDSALYLFGNGGSAALASHAACDLGKGTTKSGRRPFRVVSLTDNVSLLTAWANDTSFDNVFAAQLRPFIRERDIAFAISASGNSPNVLGGLQVAREMGACNVGLSGFRGGKMKSLCDASIIVPSDNMQQIEDSHLCIMHAIFRAFRRSIEGAA
ncbi:MAG TPA: SIS domain-containing protein [Terriglobales bacterium]|nr:SIS domain-containing protein [Terriglobales bacterium]